MERVAVWRDRLVVAWGIVALLVSSIVVGVVAIVAGRPLLALCPLVLSVAVAVLHLRYRHVTEEERADIEAACVVHLTHRRTCVLSGHEVFLDPARCRIWSLAICGSWPFLRRAVFGFIGFPPEADIRYNVGRGDVWAVTFRPHPGTEMLVRGRAVALPRGYRGPAVVERLRGGSRRHDDGDTQS